MKNLYLIGPMGAGKTTAGILLSKKIGLPALDLDKEIERATGVNISWIFDKEKEAGFRLREHAALSKITQKKGLILSTGGGSILCPENRELLSSTGKVVYLSVSLNNQIKRLSTKNRPLLSHTSSLYATLSKLHAERSHLYAETAEHTIETDDIHLQVVVNRILKYLLDNDRLSKE